nr:hypothetical protein [Tanacetum cinerariifolium]
MARPNFACCGGFVESGLQERYGLIETDEGVAGKTNDVTRLQALVDKKKVVITKATIRDALRLGDAEGVDCLPDEEIFAELARVIEEEGDAEEQVQDVAADTAAQGAATAVQGDDRIDSSNDTITEDASNQGRRIDDLDKDDVVDLMDDKEAEKAKVASDDQVKGRQAEIYHIDMDHTSKVLSVQEDVPEVQEVVDVVTTAKLITEVVTAASESVTATSTTIAAAEPQVPAATITAAPVRVATTSTKRRKGVVIWDPKEESTTIISVETKSKDKGKGIMVEEPKPLKKKQQVKMDEEYARKLHEELNKDIDWNATIDHLEEEDNRAIQSINETPAQKAAKRRKLNKEVDDLKQHLEIVPDEDDDVYTEVTPLARKVLVVDYAIIHLNNKPHYKIIRADETHLYVSFITMLKNFNREDLESLWSLVKEIFSTSKPNNFSNDFLLTTLRAMFERPDIQAHVWKNQRTVYGQAKEIPTLEVYIRLNVECSKAESGRAE